MDLTGGVSKGHFLSLDSLAKDVFLAKKNPQPKVYFSAEVLSQGYIFDENPIKLAFWEQIIVYFR